MLSRTPTYKGSHRYGASLPGTGNLKLCAKGPGTMKKDKSMWMQQATK